MKYYCGFFGFATVQLGGFAVPQFAQNKKKKCGQRHTKKTAKNTDLRRRNNANRKKPRETSEYNKNSFDGKNFSIIIILCILF